MSSTSKIDDATNIAYSGMKNDEAKINYNPNSSLRNETQERNAQTDRNRTVQNETESILIINACILISLVVIAIIVLQFKAWNKKRYQTFQRNEVYEFRVRESIAPQLEAQASDSQLPVVGYQENGPDIEESQ